MIQKGSEGQVKKTFVLDTNVVLHNSDCIEKFHEHDIVIPMTVLEEIDKFKKGNEEINYNARSFHRKIIELSKQGRLSEGVSLGEDKGNIRTHNELEIHPDIRASFVNPNEPDHRILNVAYSLHKRSGGETVIYVTKDINLYLKAEALGIIVQDYTHDHIKDLRQMDQASGYYEGIDSALVKRLFDEPNGVPLEDVLPGGDLGINEFGIFRNGKHSALAMCCRSRMNPSTKLLRCIKPAKAFEISPKNAEQSFALRALLDEDIKLVALNGIAGSGKTILALAAAIHLASRYNQIMVLRPMIPLGKDIGYLPGDAETKASKYMAPIFDNLEVIKEACTSERDKIKIDNMLKDKTISVEILTYIRGRSLVKRYFIVDEAQNLRPHDVKTIISRAGEGTKIVFTGDIHQIDDPYLNINSNGLSYLMAKMQGQDIFASVRLIKGERSELATLAATML